MKRIDSGRMDEEEEEGEEEVEDEKASDEDGRASEEERAGSHDHGGSPSSDWLGGDPLRRTSVKCPLRHLFPGPVSLASTTKGLRLRRSGKKRSSDHFDRYEQDEHESVYTDDSDEAENEHDSYNPLSSSLTVPPLPSHPDRTGQVLITKFGKRLRQRIPSALSLHPSSTFLSPLSLASFSSDLKQRLMESSWFTLVDDILMQNALVKALAAFVRPAEHFFQTSLQLWSSQRVEDIKRLEAALEDNLIDVEGEEGEVEDGHVEDARISEVGMDEVEETKAASVTERRTDEVESSRAMQLENNSPHSSTSPLTVPTFSPSLFTTVNPAASFSSSPLPSTHANHANHISTSHPSTCSIHVRYSDHTRPPSSHTSAYTSQPSVRPPPLAPSHLLASVFIRRQHSSRVVQSTSSTFLPRIIPPSPTSFLSTSTLSPSSSLTGRSCV